MSTSMIVANSGPINGVFNTGDGVDVADLSPEELMYYCEGQMSSLDSAANSYFAESQKNGEISKQVNDALAQLNALQTQISANPDQPAAVAALQQALTNIQSADPKDASAIDSALKVLTTDGHGGTDTKLSTDDISSIENTLKDVSSNLQSDDSLAMVRLQSLMSQREQCISLSTNILQTLSETDAKVIGNIRA